MSKLLKKILLLVVILIFPFVVELFILPIDAFTFRCWEALLVLQYEDRFPGPFFPNKHIERTEVGDMGHGTQWAFERHSKWETDSMGYRKAVPSGVAGEANDTHYEIVVLGDSTAAGAGLSQKEILSEILERKLSVPAYPHAPSDINVLLRDIRFWKPGKFPSLVVLCLLERGFITTPLANPNNLRLQAKSMKPEKYPWLWYWELRERMYKRNMYNFLRARVLDFLERKVHNRRGDMLFFEGDGAFPVLDDSELEIIAENIASQKEILSKLGVRLIFLPVPNKESIYSHLFGSFKVDLIPRLLEKLSEKQVETIDLLSAFKTEVASGGEVYFRDDTHWNPNGVKIAADLIVKHYEDTLGKPSNQSNP